MVFGENGGMLSRKSGKRRADEISGIVQQVMDTATALGLKKGLPHQGTVLG